MFKRHLVHRYVLKDSGIKSHELQTCFNGHLYIDKIQKHCNKTPKIETNAELS